MTGAQRQRVTDQFARQLAVGVESEFHRTAPIHTSTQSSSFSTIALFYWDAVLLRNKSFYIEVAFLRWVQEPLAMVSRLIASLIDEKAKAKRWRRTKIEGVARKRKKSIDGRKSHFHPIKWPFHKNSCLFICFSYIKKIGKKLALSLT